MVTTSTHAHLHTNTCFVMVMLKISFRVYVLLTQKEIIGPHHSTKSECAAFAAAAAALLALTRGN